MTDTSHTLERLLSAPKKLRQEALIAAEAALSGDHDVLLVTQAKAAKILGCSRFTIHNMVLDGTLHPVTIRGVLRYRISELRHLADNGSGHAPPKRRTKNRKDDKGPSDAAGGDDAKEQPPSAVRPSV